MAAPITEYVYDPTRRFHNIYDYSAGLVLMTVGSLTTIIMTIVTIGMIFGDHNYIAGSITGIVLLLAIFIASPMLHCSDKSIVEKREVYDQYRSMGEIDRKNYVNYIRIIHNDHEGIESINYQDLIKLFKSKSFNNPSSIESRRAQVKQELEDLKATERLNAVTKAEIDNINKSFDL